MEKIEYLDLPIGYLSELQRQTKKICLGCSEGCNPSGMTVFKGDLVDFTIEGEKAGDRKACEVVYHNYFPGDEVWWGYIHNSSNIL